MKRIGVDVGGTFTDLIYVDDVKGTVLVHKTPSTPADPSIATVDGIKVLCQNAGIKPAELDQVFHGTTVATNIDRKSTRLNSSHMSESRMPSSA